MTKGLRSQIDGKDIFIKTVKDRKGEYGRYLAEILLPNAEGELININDLMVSEGHAVYKDY